MKDKWITDNGKASDYEKFLEIINLIDCSKSEMRDKLVDRMYVLFFDVNTCQNTQVDTSSVDIGLELKYAENYIPLLMSRLQQQLSQLDVLVTQKVLDHSLPSSSCDYMLLFLLSSLANVIVSLPLNRFWKVGSLLISVLAVVIYRIKKRQQYISVYTQLEKEFGEEMLSSLENGVGNIALEIEILLKMIDDTIIELRNQKSILEGIKRYAVGNGVKSFWTEKEIEAWLFSLVKPSGEITDLGNLIESDAWKKEIPQEEKGFFKKLY